MDGVLYRHGGRRHYNYNSPKYQELTRITKEIQDGTFFENPALLDAVENCRKNDSALHLYGLVSDGGVHSHITHLFALVKMAKEQGLENGYRIISNVGEDAGQTVKHLHFHVLGGEKLPV